MKMYYYYGVMGSSKTANALMVKFNFEEHNRRVLLIKPSLDTRAGKTIVMSRAGLSSKALVINKEDSIKEILKNREEKYEIIIVDECQFLTKEQVDELRSLDNGILSVMCYGLKTDYMCRLFEGSKRLLEVADSIREIKSMCPCGKKAIVNAKFINEKIIYEGEQIDIGGNEKYKALCYDCWKKGRI